MFPKVINTAPLGAIKGTFSVCSVKEVRFRGGTGVFFSMKRRQLAK